MDQQGKTEELRQMLRVARMLRQAADQENPHVADLFQRAAGALETRASDLAYGTPATDVELHAPVDLVC